MAANNEANLQQLWNATDASVKDAFIKSYGLHPVPLNRGVELYKYSGATPYSAKHSAWSPWWSLVDGPEIKLKDGRSERPPTFNQMFERARRLKVSDVRMTRVRSAVMDEWNDLDHLWVVNLTVAAWGYFGRNSGLKTTAKNPDRANLYNIGGNYQVWIPALGRDDLHLVRDEARSGTGKI